MTESGLSTAKLHALTPLSGLIRPTYIDYRRTLDLDLLVSLIRLSVFGFALWCRQPCAGIKLFQQEDLLFDLFQLRAKLRNDSCNVHGMPFPPIHQSPGSPQETTCPYQRSDEGPSRTKGFPLLAGNRRAHHRDHRDCALIHTFFIRSLPITFIGPIVNMAVEKPRR